MGSDSTRSSPTLSERRERRNVLIVGDVGVGKSSLVNLIAGSDQAAVSGGVTGCTLRSQEYSVAVDGVEFALHDTAGLHEAKGNMKTTDYLNAVRQACALISRLEQTGGISLLVFCMKGSRITITTQQTYSLFAEVLCNHQVPVVIAVTHLEMYPNMEAWWRENEEAIKGYGLRSLGHACITATRGYENMFSGKYEQSKGIIRKLLLDYSGQTARIEEKVGWVKRMVLHMRSWLSPDHVKKIKKSDLKRKLVKRCGLSTEVAELVAQKVEESRRTLWDALKEESF